MDKFDLLRAALFENKDFHRLVMTGANVRSEWFTQPIVPAGVKSPGSNDMFILKGSKTINGEIYLIANFSFSLSVPWGDNGNFYLSRKVVNKELLFAYMFMDEDPDEIKKQWNILQKMWNVLQLMLKWLKNNPTLPVQTPIPAPITPQDEPKPPEPIVPSSQIPAFAEGIFEAEGNGKQAGMALNNRGDLKYTAYTKSLGAIGSGFNNFAVFRTMEDGDNACRQLLTDACSNKLLGYHDATLNQFCQTYGNPPILSNYVSVVLKHLPGRTGSTLIKDLL